MSCWRSRSHLAQSLSRQWALGVLPPLVNRAARGHGDVRVYFVKSLVSGPPLCETRASSCGAEGRPSAEPTVCLALGWRPHLHHFVLPGAPRGEWDLSGVAPLAELGALPQPACSEAIRLCPLGYSSHARDRRCDRKRRPGHVGDTDGEASPWHVVGDCGPELSTRAVKSSRCPGPTH